MYRLDRTVPAHGLKGSRIPFLWVQAERAGTLQCGEKKAQGSYRLIDIYVDINVYKHLWEEMKMEPAWYIKKNDIKFVGPTCFIL